MQRFRAEAVYTGQDGETGSVALAMEGEEHIVEMCARALVPEGASVDAVIMQSDPPHV